MAWLAAVLQPGDGPGTFGLALSWRLRLMLGGDDCPWCLAIASTWSRPARRLGYLEAQMTLSAAVTGCYGDDLPSTVRCEND